MIRPVNHSDTASTSFEAENITIQQGSGQYGYSETQSSIDFGDCSAQTTTFIQDYVFSPIYNYVLTPLYHFFRFIGQLLGCPCACSEPDEEHFGDETSSIDDAERLDDTHEADDARSDDGALSLDSLELTDAHKEHIRWIYQHLSQDNILSLGFLTSELERQGHELDNLHPFRNLAFVFSDDNLFRQYQEIRARTAAVSGRFINSYNVSLTDYQRRGELLPYVDSLADTMRADPAIVREFVVSRNWNEMVAHFIGIRSGSIPAYVPPRPDESARRLEAGQPEQATTTRAADAPRAPHLTQRQVSNLRDIFKAVAETNHAALPFQTNNIRTKMHALSTASPKLILQFIATDPAVIGHFRTILLDTLKRRHFMSDFQDRVLGRAVTHNHADVNDAAFWTSLHLPTPISWEAGLQNIIRSKILTVEQILVKLFETVATHNVMALGTTDLPQLLMLWGDLEGEKPLDVLTIAFSNETCLGHLTAIHNDTNIFRQNLKKGPFINSFSGALQAGARNHPIDAEVFRAFCQRFAITGMDAGPANIDWKELVKILFQTEVEQAVP